jgi:hypothetical protein
MISNIITIITTMITITLTTITILIGNKNYKIPKEITCI